MIHFMLPAARRFATFVIVALVASGAMAEPKLRPFEARLSIAETIVIAGSSPCFLVGSVTASGNASHLGQVTATSSDCINPSGSDSFIFASSGEGPTGGLVFTAANGDTLYAKYIGTLTQQPSGPHLITGHFTISGGTGRFVEATGGGTLTGTEVIDFTAGTGSGEIEAIGTIAY